MLLAWASAEIFVRVDNPKQAHNTEKKVITLWKSPPKEHTFTTTLWMFMVTSI